LLHFSAKVEWYYIWRLTFFLDNQAIAEKSKV